MKNDMISQNQYQNYNKTANQKNYLRALNYTYEQFSKIDYSQSNVHNLMEEQYKNIKSRYPLINTSELLKDVSIILTSMEENQESAKKIEEFVQEEQEKEKRKYEVIVQKNTVKQARKKNEKEKENHRKNIERKKRLEEKYGKIEFF